MEGARGGNGEGGRGKGEVVGGGRELAVGERILAQMGAEEERRGKVGEKPRSRRYTNIVLD